MMQKPMRKLKLLNEIPISSSSQNPLLSAEEFFKYCKQRFENVGITEDAFLWLLNLYKKKGLLLPTYSENEVDYYSTFQVYNLYKLEECRIESLKPRAYIKRGKHKRFLIANWQQFLETNTDFLKTHIEKFNKLLLLLFKIQDFLS
jgi:hypothetical protein